MESKDQNPPAYGFQAGPPAYEQHQSFPQAPPNFQPQAPIYPQQVPQMQAGQNYYPATQSAQAQVVTVITTSPFGPEPMPNIQCPSCREYITTKVDFESSSKTHLMALLVCLLCWPCFWIPYAVDSCKSANHYCPSCNAYLGRYHG